MREWMSDTATQPLKNQIRLNESGDCKIMHKIYVLKKTNTFNNPFFIY